MKRVLLSGVTALSLLTQAQSLSLEDYKKQVLEKDPETLGIQDKKKGAELTQNEAGLLTSVNFFASGGYLDDQRPTTNPGFQGTRTSVNSMAFGLQQQTSLGLKWSLSQNFQRTDIEDASITAVPVPKYYDTFPKIELTLPLWRNVLGHETRAQRDQLSHLALARKEQSEVQWTQRQSFIEESFYALLSNQEAYEIQKDSLARAERILNWSESRLKRNLVDSGDLYQAQAAVASRRLDLNQATVNLREAGRVFNSLRGVVGDEVKEKLLGLDVDLKKLKLDRNQKKVRQDFRAQSHLNSSEAAGFAVSREKNKPNLDLTLQGWTQGRGATWTTSGKNTFEDQDYLFVGLTFSMPLDQLEQSRIRDGYSALNRGQLLTEQARLRDEPLTWDKTVDQAQQLSQQVEILRQLEVVQRKKADSERDKLNRGRSTAFQVLSFEQDYNMARSLRIRAEFEARKLINSLNLYVDVQ